MIVTALSVVYDPTDGLPPEAWPAWFRERMAELPAQEVVSVHAGTPLALLVAVCGVEGERDAGDDFAAAVREQLGVPDAEGWGAEVQHRIAQLLAFCAELPEPPERRGSKAPVCCTSHTEPTCCDPNDCGPCCENCPTCPTLAERRRVAAHSPSPSEPAAPNWDSPVHWWSLGSLLGNSGREHPLAMCSQPRYAAEMAAELNAREIVAVPAVAAEAQRREDLAAEFRRQIRALQSRTQTEGTAIHSEHVEMRLLTADNWRAVLGWMDAGKPYYGRVGEVTGLTVFITEHARARADFGDVIMRDRHGYFSVIACSQLGKSEADHAG